jgi:glycosyltransferase involved in cell wall biosynthesis
MGKARCAPRAPAGTGPRDVVYVIASMIVGGTQTHLLQVFRFLDRERYRPHLYCLRDEGNLIETARGLDVPVETFGMRGSLRHPGDFAGLLRMRSVMKALDPSIVHGYLLRGNFFAAAAARAAGVPVVVTSKRGLHAPAGAGERFAVGTSNRLSDIVTGNSPAVLEFTREIERAPSLCMEMIPSGVDTARFDPAVARSLRDELGLGDAPIVGTAITFRPRKGFRMLFEAFAAVRERIPDARLLIAGADAYEPDPEALARQLGILDAITLLGRRSDMPDVLQSFDVFVLPSQSEGMSNAILEAMAMGLPVVATAVGGAPVVIDEGRTGFLVEYPDSAALAERLGRLLPDAELRGRVGAAARETVVEGYSAAVMVRTMEELYDRLLAGR